MRNTMLVAIAVMCIASVTSGETRVIDDKSFTYEGGKWYQEFGGKQFEVIPDVITVKFIEGAESRAVEEFNSSISVTVKSRNKLGIYDLKIPRGSDPLDYVMTYKASGLVEFAEACTYGEYVVTPNDSYFGSSQWNLHNTGQTGGTADADIDAPEGWDIEKGSNTAVISILDSGTDIDHPDLISNMWKNTDEIPDNYIDDDENGYIDDYDGWDFYNGNNDPNGPYDHGTHVAGIAGAMTNNSAGIAGVAGGWYPGQQGCLLMPIGVGDFAPDGSILDDAIIYSADNGAKVLTMSLSVGPSAAINSAIDYAVNTMGCIVDCASGNDYGAISYPAYLSDVIAVGSTNHNDVRAPYSNYGPELDIAAPGGDASAGIYSTMIGGGYDWMYGTSMAAPHVAGLAGLLFSQGPGRTNTEVRSIIESTADDLGSAGWDQYYGWGRINVYAALSYGPDIIPPADVTDLAAATGSGNGEVDLTWTAPGDDGAVGTATTYDVRYVPYANGPIDTEAEWTTASQASDEPSPGPAGSTESWTLTGLTAGSSYYFALKTVDEVPNWSGLSNSPSATAGEGVTRDYANQDIDVAGTRSGSYQDTYSSNDVYESITEVASKGNPAKRRSQLEHKWTIDVTAGETVTFNVEAHHSANAENDDFTFAYSTDDAAYTDMLTVTKTSDNNTVQTYTFTGPISGTVYIRVTDMDRTPGNSELTTVYIDWMYTQSSGTPPPQKMHVQNIDMTTQTQIKGKTERTKAIATVTVVDSLDNPVSGATVYGEWTGLTTGTDQGTTDGSGQVSLESDQVKSACGTYYFCVTNVAKSGWTYEPDKNVETCDEIYYCGGGLAGNGGSEQVQAGGDASIPEVFRLEQNYPNPFSVQTRITFGLATDAHVILEVYNVTGQLVETLLDESMNAGHHSADWDAPDVPSGLYFYSIEAGDYRAIRRMLILR